jgi:formate hydrogenlyase subunit 3/multisubunit Na+/H+ antiporter MnhD subunit
MSTPVIWVIFPIIVAGICIFLSSRRRLTMAIASLTAFVLALLAAFFPEELNISIGPLAITLVESLHVLGRKLNLIYGMFPMIALIYGTTGLWLLTSNLPGVPKAFQPASLVIAATITAALGVEPFLYAALFIETAVLISVPMLTSLGGDKNQGILRYLSLMTIAMPFILIAGWLLSGVVTLPSDSPLIGQSAVVLGLGFAIWLAVFPFHNWVPMVSQTSHPVVSSFLLFILPTGILVFGLNFLNRYGFLRSSETLFNIIRITGALMIAFGGVLTAAQDLLKRAFGFSALTEIGYSLLALGMASEGGIIWLLLMFPARALGYWLWGYTLSRFESNYDVPLNLDVIQGDGRRVPILSTGLILAQLSVAGLPLLASFPIKIALLTQAMVESKVLGGWSLFGALGLFLFSIRVLLSLYHPGDFETQQPLLPKESFLIYLPVILAIGLLVVLGLFPGKLFSGIINTLSAFPQLQ